MRKNRVKIYQSRVHLFATLLFIIAPFVFLLLFSRISHIATARLFQDTIISLARLCVAYIIAVALAWIFAISFYRGKRSAIALPIFDVLQSFPNFAAVPLAAILFGQTNFVIIFFLVITIIWPIFFSIISSLKLMKHDWEEAIEISGLKGKDYVRYFLWPVSVPGLITGSIIGLGDGWGALVGTEIIVGTNQGLGEFFRSFSNNPTTTLFGILGVLIIVFSINKLVWSPLLDWSHHVMEE